MVKMLTHPVNTVPMSILDAIPSEGKCRALVRQSCFGQKPFCPRCLSTHVRSSEQRYWCPHCRRKFSLTSATWLKGRKVSYRTIVLLIICWQKKVAFGTTVALSGTSAPTVRRYFRLFRQHLVYTSPVLEGTVETDEAWLGKRRHGNQTMVIGGIERKRGRAVIRIIPHRDQEWSDRFLLDHVSADAHVATDGWEGYRGIDDFFGYTHEWHIHDQGDFGPTNQIEGLWSRLKRFITRTWDHCWREHLPDLLTEFEARINAPELFTSPRSFLTTCLVVVPSAC